jgi:hypothetical protein
MPGTDLIIGRLSPRKRDFANMEGRSGGMFVASF